MHPPNFPIPEIFPPYPLPHRKIEFFYLVTCTTNERFKCSHFVLVGWMENGRPIPYPFPLPLDLF